MASTDADWLDEAATYFEQRPTGGEDMAFWANAANAERCRAIASGIRARVGVMVDSEPSARIIAAVFVQTQDPSEADQQVARQALALLPSSPVEKVTSALADLSRDYRAFVKVAQVTQP